MTTSQDDVMAEIVYQVLLNKPITDDLWAKGYGKLREWIDPPLTKAIIAAGGTTYTGDFPKRRAYISLWGAMHHAAKGAGVKLDYSDDDLYERDIKTLAGKKLRWSPMPVSGQTLLQASLERYYCLPSRVCAGAAEVTAWICAGAAEVTYGIDTRSINPNQSINPANRQINESKIMKSIASTPFTKITYIYGAVAVEMSADQLIAALVRTNVEKEALMQLKAPGAFVDASIKRLNEARDSIIILLDKKAAEVEADQE